VSRDAWFVVVLALAGGLCLGAAGGGLVADYRAARDGYSRGYAAAVDSVMAIPSPRMSRIVVYPSWSDTLKFYWDKDSVFRVGPPR
jgi:hypothetical protein